jgi:hypothetical protein
VLQHLTRVPLQSLPRDRSLTKPFENLNIDYDNRLRRVACYGRSDAKTWGAAIKARILGSERLRLKLVARVARAQRLTNEFES